MELHDHSSRHNLFLANSGFPLSIWFPDLIPRAQVASEVKKRHICLQTNCDSQYVGRSYVIGEGFRWRYTVYSIYSVRVLCWLGVFYLMGAFRALGLLTTTALVHWLNSLARSFLLACSISDSYTLFSTKGYSHSLFDYRTHKGIHSFVLNI